MFLLSSGRTGMSRASTKESTDQKDLHAQRESGCLSKNELAGEGEVLLAGN
jgi:hypothetical protein